MGVEVRCPRCHARQAGYNAKCKGCGVGLVNLRKKGELTFCVYGYKGKKKIYLSETYSTLKDAQAADGKRGSDKRNGLDPVQFVKGDKQTLAELIDWYLKHEAKRNVDIRTKNDRLKPVKKILGDRMLKDIRPTDLEEYQGIRGKKGRAPSTIDKELIEAQAMINKAAKNRMVSPQAKEVFTEWKRLLPNKNANRRTRFLTEEEFWTLYEHLPKHLKPVFLCAISTGMRLGEITALTWDRVDLKRRIIYLEAKHTKEKAAKTEYISDMLLEVLEGLPRYADEPHVFLFAGGPIGGDMRTGIRAACEKAGIPYGRDVPGGFIFHDLRRSFRRLMRKAGIDRDVIRTFTGHHSEEMDSRYNVIEDADRKEALQALETLLTPGRSKSRSTELH